MKVPNLLLVLGSVVALSAQADVRSFSGDCSLSLKGQEFKTIGTFHLKGETGNCPSETLEFSVDEGNGEVREYGLYIEFQRGAFAPGKTDKPYIGLYDKSDRVVNNRVRAFNVKPGTILDFHQELKGDARLFCSGEIG